ncbi:O-antigen ligase family protein [Candidatus Sumerlaeota bacterium]|nr:O-antigen ligase family protein [Candidatus Sumerlaeota bacterium]
MERSRAMTEKVGRNVSLSALAVILALVPFQDRFEIPRHAAEFAVLGGFLVRLYGQMGRRFWVTAALCFVGSLCLFGAIAAASVYSGRATENVLQIMTSFITQVGALYLFMILVFLSQFVFRPEMWRVHERPIKITLALAWAFGIIVIISAICSTDHHESFRFVRKYLAPYLLVYAIAVETFYSWRHYRILLTTIYLTGIIVTSASVTARYLYNYGGHNLRREFLQSKILRSDTVRDEETNREHEELRNQWPLGHHNRLCSYALMIAVIVWLQFFVTRDWELKTLVAISAVVPIWCMLLTLTRGGWLAGLAAALALIVVINWRSIWVLAVVAALTWAVSPAVVRNRMVSAFRPSTYTQPKESVRTRWEIWGISLEIIRRHPLLGIGAGWEVFQDYVRVHFASDDPTKSEPHAHNNFLCIGAESGVGAMAAFIAFTALLFGQIGRAVRQTARQSKARFVSAGFFTLLTAITVYGLTNYSLRYTIGMEIWIIFALMTMLPVIARAIPTDERASVEAEVAKPAT